MNILFINGSPNENGNTANLASILLNGKEYETLNLTNFTIGSYGQTLPYDGLDRVIEKMKEAKNFIGEGKMAIEFTGRDLSELEENVLIDLIRLHSNLNIVYVFSGEKIKEVNRFSLFHSISEEGPTKFFRGTLRSGSKLEYDGG